MWILRRLALASVLLLALSGSARAEEPLGHDHPRHIDDLQLLPIEEHRWMLIRLTNEKVFERVERASDRLEMLQERMEEEGASAWLRAEREGARKALGSSVKAALALLARHGVDAEAWNRAARTPRGPRRVARLAHAQVLAVVDPAGRPGRLLARLVHALDAAQIVLASLRDREDENEGEAGRLVGAEEREARLEERIELMERRFWRLVDWVLDDRSKATLRKRLPMPYQTWDDLFEHAYFLPGITIGQQGRVRALIAGLEAESGPDEALMDRFGRVADDERKTEEEREKAGHEMRAIERRLSRRHLDAFARLERMLKPAQWAAFQAIPPHVDPGARLEGPQEALEGIAFRDAQVRRLGPISEKYKVMRERTEAEVEKIERRRKDMGPDSPQMQAMDMLEAGAEARLGAEARVLMREVFLDVLEPHQVVRWMLGVSGT